MSDNVVAFPPPKGLQDSDVVHGCGFCGRADFYLVTSGRVICTNCDETATNIEVVAKSDISVETDG